ncbi:transmembrane signal receptor [Lithospermum erythrorhizon]|uniref:Transmembrane signal receptor n=1 Tax=Lithospermum erythrorhizon TaxID=34254 RepID=A0AAV3R2R6_LITER
MEAHLEANDLWETVEEDYEVPPLKDNYQVRNEKERKTKKSKVKATLFTAVFEEIVTSIMTIKSAFEIWNFLKTEELDKSQVSKVRMGNGDHIDVIGNGVVAIASCTGTKLISNIFYVPDIDQNLLSVGQLVENGFKVIFANKVCLIKDENDNDVFKIKMRGKSFSLNHMEEEQVACPAITTTTELCHKKLGHFHHATLLNMQKKRLVFGLPHMETDLPTCRACHFGKQTRLPFQQSTWRATEKLHLIHIDLCGLHNTPSLNGSKYFIAFIDDFTRMCWVYFLRFKTDVAGVFFGFKHWIENQCGCIEHQLTTPYTPQQNGVSERKNRTIMEMARCMLHEKDLPKEYWAEAANTVVFLLNRVPTKAVNGKTPFEAWHGYRPFLKNLKVFGCLCFTHVPQVKSGKLDKKAESSVFIGYSSTSKAYRVFQPDTRKILISRDVSFMGNDKWSCNTTENQSTPELNQNELVDDLPVRGPRSVVDIYQRCSVVVLEPGDYFEAEKDHKWSAAMQEELFMIEKNQTWKLIERPQNQNVIGDKWVFRTKKNPDGSINKFKATLVVKGYAKNFGVDFSDTFAPVARLDTIRMLLAIAAQKKWKIYQLDVKSAFLNGILEEDIYVEQLEGFVMKGHEDKAPRAWYSIIDEYLLNFGFVRNLSESTLYIKGDQAHFIIVSVYVDDLLVTENNSEVIQHFMEDMMQVFEMTDLREMSYFLGIEIKRRQNEVFICQEKYAKELLKKFNMENYKIMKTPMCQKEKLCQDDGSEKVDESHYRSLIECLMYLTTTRPDIFSKKQEVVAQSTAETEFIAATSAVNHTLWLRKILSDLHLEQKMSTDVMVDNQAAISISNNPVFHGKTKHFSIKLFFIKDVQKDGEVRLKSYKTEEQLADIFTEPFAKIRFEELREKLGICIY